MEALAVAAKKKAPAKLGSDDVIIMTMKCRQEWRDWTMKVADAERASLATLGDQLLAERARERSLSDPPPRWKD